MSGRRASTGARLGAGLGHGIDTVCMWLAVSGGLLFIGAALISLTSIVGRALLSVPLPGDYEVVKTLCAVAIAMCLPYCETQRNHITVTFFSARFPGWVNRFLDVQASVLLVGISALLIWRTWAGMVDMREYGERSMVLEFPVWWAYAFMLPSLLMLCLAGARSAVTLACSDRPPA